MKGHQDTYNTAGDLVILILIIECVAIVIRLILVNFVLFILFIAVNNGRFMAKEKEMNEYLCVWMVKEKSSVSTLA